MSKVQFFSQFCDDIRRELDGRISLMGLYQGNVEVDLGTDESIPRVWVHATLVIPISYDLENVSILTQWNDKTIQSFDLPQDGVEEFHSQSKSATKNSAAFILNIASEIKDLDIGAGGTLRTVANINAESIKGLPLRILVSGDGGRS